MKRVLFFCTAMLAVLSCNAQSIQVLKNGEIIFECSETNGVEVVFKEKEEEPADPYNGHEYVDLGLPSGLKWATCNIGANNETESGLYFWWGDIQGYDKNDSSFDFSGNNNMIITHGKYQNALYASSIVDRKYRWKYDRDIDYYDVFDLTAQYDAATQKWGENWHMPTIGDIKELIDNCTCQYINTAEKQGYKFTSSNGNSIFIPSAGYKIGTTVYYGNSGYATIHSSTAVDSETTWATQFPSFIMGMYDSLSSRLWSYSYRYYGRPIRPVTM